MSKNLIPYNNPVVKKAIGGFFIGSILREATSIETIEVKTRNYNIGAKFKKTHEDDADFTFVVKRRKRK